MRRAIERMVAGVAMLIFIAAFFVGAFHIVREIVLAVMYGLGHGAYTR